MNLEVKILKYEHHEDIWKRKVTIESKFNVRIFSPYFEGKSRVSKILPGIALKDIGLYSIIVEGKAPNVMELKKHFDEIFVHPEITGKFAIGKNLESVFCQRLWAEVLEDIYAVFICVDKKSLSISGTTLSVTSAISAMEDLESKYEKFIGKFSTGESQSLEELSSAVRLCKGCEVDVHTLKHFPEEAISVLISWLKEAYKEKFLLCNNDVMSLDESIVVLDAPEDKPTIPVITLDSDHESEVIDELIEFEVSDESPEYQVSDEVMEFQVIDESSECKGIDEMSNIEAIDNSVLQVGNKKRTRKNERKSKRQCVGLSY